MSKAAAHALKRHVAEAEHNTMGFPGAHLQSGRMRLVWEVGTLTLSAGIAALLGCAEAGILAAALGCSCHPGSA